MNCQCDLHAMNGRVRAGTAKKRIQLIYERTYNNQQSKVFECLMHDIRIDHSMVSQTI